MAENLDQIRIIFDNMPYLAWMKDKDGRYVEVNRTFAKFCCKDNSEIIGKCVHEVFSGELVAAYQQVDDAVLKCKKPQFLDHIYEEGPRDNKWFDTYVAPLLGEDGDVEGTIGFSRKISKRKRLEMELEHQKRFLRTMIDTIPDIVVYKDSDSKILGCNKACMERFYGVAEEQEAIGKTTLDIMKDKELAKSCLLKDQEVFIGDQTLKVEEQYVLVDGTELDFETVKTPYHDKQGSVAGLIAISRDITDRKKAEQEIRKREQETQRELNLAAKVQLNTLPEPFNGKKVRVNTLFMPYHTVSGDLFNYKWFEDQDKMRGYIVDVSGHGIATALQTASVKMLLDTTLLGGKEINEDDFQFINLKMKQYLYEESFAGVMYFEFNFKTNILKVISGGINFLLAAKPAECSLIPVFSGFMGMFDDTDLQTLTMPFKDGEVYCMMTDGVSDLIEMYGVSRQHGLSGYTAWLEEISKSSERSDDFSAVAIEIIQTNEELNVTCTQNDGELAYTRQIISNFLEENIPCSAVMLEVAINEAINNSLSASGHVRVKIRPMRDKLLVRVKDNGPGFNTGKAEATFKTAACDELFDELGLKERGRGILMMKILCDRLLFNAKGNEVLLIKKRNLANEEDAFIDYMI